MLSLILIENKSSEQITEVQYLKELIESYEKEAGELEKLLERLKDELSTERNVTERKLLQKRIYAADVERFEIMEDINAMRKYL